MVSQASGKIPPWLPRIGPFHRHRGRAGPCVITIRAGPGGPVGDRRSAPPRGSCAAGFVALIRRQNECPFSRRFQAAASISARPRAGQRFMNERQAPPVRAQLRMMRIRASAVRRPGSRDTIRSPMRLRRRPRASTRRRAWQPAHFFQIDHPGQRVARRISFREIAAEQSGFQARPFRRTGMTGSAPCARIAAWQRRVSWAPSAVTVSIFSAAWTCDSRSGRIGLPPCRPEANSAARMSPVALSSAR